MQKQILELLTCLRIGESIGLNAHRVSFGVSNDALPVSDYLLFQQVKSGWNPVECRVSWCVSFLCQKKWETHTKK